MKKLLLVLGVIVAILGVVFGILALIERKGSHKPLTAIKVAMSNVKAKFAALRAAKGSPKV